MEIQYLGNLLDRLPRIESKMRPENDAIDFLIFAICFGADCEGPLPDRENLAHFGTTMTLNALHQVALDNPGEIRQIAYQLVPFLCPNCSANFLTPEIAHWTEKTAQPVPHFCDDCCNWEPA